MEVLRSGARPPTGSRRPGSLGIDRRRFLTPDSRRLTYPMLHLHAPTHERWIAQVDAHLDEVLIDHAHCEKKAAGTALNLIFHYVENRELCREMTEIVGEELEHFHMVLDLLDRRGIKFRRLKPSQYGRKLGDLVRKQEPQRAVDRLLVAGLSRPGVASGSKPSPSTSPPRETTPSSPSSTAASSRAKPDITPRTRASRSTSRKKTL
jgi:hypothetical protein